MSGEGGLEVGKAFVDLVPRLGAGFASKVSHDVDGPLERARRKAGQVGKALAVGFAAAATAAVAVGAKSVHVFDDTAKEVLKLKRYMGGTAEETSRFRAAAQLAGVDVNQLSRAVGIFSKGLASGKLDGYAASLKESGKNSADLTKASAKLADAKTKLADLDRIQGSKAKLTVADDVAKKNALAAVAKAEDAVTAARGRGTKVTAEILGVSTRDADGRLKPLAKLLPDLAEKFKNMPDGPEKTAAAMKLFGRSGADLLPFLNKGKAGIADLEKEADKLGVTLTQKDLDAVKENTKNQRLFHLALQGVQIQIGRFLEPALAGLFTWLAARLPAALNFTKKALAAVSGAVSSVIGGFTGTGKVTSRTNETLVKFGRKAREVYDVVVKSVTRFVGAVVKFFKGNPDARFAAVAAVLGGIFLAAIIAVGTALAAAFSPVYLIVAAVLALAAGLIYAYKHFASFRDVVNKTVTWIKTNVPPAFAAMRAGIAVAIDWIRTKVVPVVETVALAIAAKIGQLVGWVRAHWTEIKAIFVGALNVIHAIINGALAAIEWLWRTWGKSLLGILRAVWNWILEAIAAALKIVRGIIDVFLGVIHGHWSQAWHGLLGILRGAWDLIFAGLREVGKIMVEILRGILHTLGFIWGKAWGAMKGVLGGLWDGFLDGGTAILNGLIAGIEGIVNIALKAVLVLVDAYNHIPGVPHIKGLPRKITLPRLGDHSPAAQKTVPPTRDPGTLTGGRKGGGDVWPGRWIVGEAGPELLDLKPNGRGHVVSNRDLQRVGAGAPAGDHYETNVDARGVTNPEEVADLASRHIAWRVSRRRPRR